MLLFFFRGGGVINLFIKNTANILIAKNFKTWLKTSSQN